MPALGTNPLNNALLLCYKLVACIVFFTEISGQEHPVNTVIPNADNKSGEFRLPLLVVVLNHQVVN